MTPTVTLAVLGLGHETNTFSSQKADLALYRDGGLHRGAELVAHHGDAQTTFAGFLEPDGLEASVRLVPLVSAWVNPRGPITAEAFTAIVGEMVTVLAEQGPFDGVLLGLHGAAVADGCADADAEITRRVREVVGDDVPVGAVVDMHANLSEAMASKLDVLVPYQTNPHVDARARGRECRDLVLDIIRSGQRPGLALERLPLVVGITSQDTAHGPMADLLAIAADLEAEDGVLDCSLVEGFPYADVPQMGMSVVACHRDGPDAARDVARRLARQVWGRREELRGDGLGIEVAIDRILAHRDGRPMLVLDVGDNVGGGGPGDSTVLLAELVRREAGDVAVVIHDPAAVASLDAATVGEQVEVEVGGRSIEQDGSPVALRARLVGRSDGRYEEPRMAHGGLRYFDAGAMVALRDRSGVLVVVTSKLVQPITPAQLTAVGLEPSRLRAIVAKGVNGPRAGYAPVCGEVLVVDTPGVTRLSVHEFSYSHRMRPMYPYEPEATYA